MPQLGMFMFTWLQQGGQNQGSDKISQSVNGATNNNNNNNNQAF
jgi:hypothetical protein